MVDVENTRHNIFKFNAMVLCNLGKDGASEKNQCSRCFHNVFLNGSFNGRTISLSTRVIDGK